MGQRSRIARARESTRENSRTHPTVQEDGIRLPTDGKIPCVLQYDVVLFATECDGETLESGCHHPLLPNSAGRAHSQNRRRVQNHHVRSKMPRRNPRKNQLAATFRRDTIQRLPWAPTDPAWVCSGRRL